MATTNDTEETVGKGFRDVNKYIVSDLSTAKSFKVVASVDGKLRLVDPVQMLREVLHLEVVDGKLNYVTETEESDSTSTSTSSGS